MVFYTCRFEGKETKLYPGDTQVVKPGVYHRFRTDKNGCILRKYHSHRNDDSFYQDAKINSMLR